MEPAMPSSEPPSSDPAQLLSLPIEITTDIYGQLPLLSDILSLASTCQRLRSVWNSNKSQIFRRFAPKGIPCYRHALAFLREQRQRHGLAADAGSNGNGNGSSKFSAEDVDAMIRNYHAVENAVRKFEADVVARVWRKYSITLHLSFLLFPYISITPLCWGRLSLATYPPQIQIKKDTI
jgi:hypothetical protein